MAIVTGRSRGIGQVTIGRLATRGYADKRVQRRHVDRADHRMIVVGGIGTIEGPIIGAVVWFLAEDYLTNERSAVSVATETYLIACGLMAVPSALYVRNGVPGVR